MKELRMDYGTDEALSEVLTGFSTGDSVTIEVTGKVRENAEGKFVLDVSEISEPQKKEPKEKAPEEDNDGLDEGIEEEVPASVEAMKIKKKDE